jgi:hypothetical protein
MLDSPILEVALGLIFVYSLLAILVTQINTVIANIFNLRARHLKAAIRDLIIDPTTQARFMTHPLIALVKRPLSPDRPLSAQGAESIVESGTSDVSWIEPTVFADVMTDLITTQATADTDVYAPLLRIGNAVLDPAQKAQMSALVRRVQAGTAPFEDLLLFVNGLPDVADRQALLQPLNGIEAAMLDYGTDSQPLMNLYRGLRNIQNAEFQRALDTVLKTAKSIEEANERLAQWFDKSMNLVTDTYRRKLQIISLIVGLLLAIVLNIDTLQLAKTLWDDPTMRQALVIAAEAARDTGTLQQQIDTAAAAQSGALQAQPTPAASNALPQGDFAPSAEATAQPPTDTQEALLDLGESAADTAASIESILALRLPIGWHFTEVDGNTQSILGSNPLTDSRNAWNLLPGNSPEWFGLLFRKIIGIILTTIAVSQGAPFWFDLMNRIAHGGRSSS